MAACVWAAASALTEGKLNVNKDQENVRRRAEERREGRTFVPTGRSSCHPTLGEVFFLSFRERRGDFGPCLLKWNRLVPLLLPVSSHRYLQPRSLFSPFSWLVPRCLDLVAHVLFLYRHITFLRFTEFNTRVPTQIDPCPSGVRALARWSVYSIWTCARVCYVHTRIQAAASY